MSNEDSTRSSAELGEEAGMERLAGLGRRAAALGFRLLVDDSLGCCNLSIAQTGVFEFEADNIVLLCVDEEEVDLWLRWREPDEHIRAFLHGMCPLRGSDFSDDETFQRGKCVVQRLASGSRTAALAPQAYTDVIYWLARVEPCAGAALFWDDRGEDGDGHMAVGLQHLLGLVERHLVRVSSS